MCRNDPGLPCSEPTDTTRVRSSQVLLCPLSPKLVSMSMYRAPPAGDRLGGIAVQTAVGFKRGRVYGQGPKTALVLSPLHGLLLKGTKGERGTLNPLAVSQLFPQHSLPHRGYSHSQPPRRREHTVNCVTVGGWAGKPQPTCPPISWLRSSSLWQSSELRETAWPSPTLPS